MNASRTAEIPVADEQEMQRSGDRAGEPLLWRVVALIGLLTIADLWASHHMGWGVRNPGALAVVLAVLGAMGKLVGRAFPNEVKQVSGRIASQVRSLASDSVLAIVGLALLLVVSTFSSVIVLPESAVDAQSVQLIGLDDADAKMSERAAARGELIRFRVRTNPFGRAVRLDAPGYVPAAFTVYPVVGLKVRLGQDMAPSPSVLFRPGVDGISALGDGATFRVRRVSGADTTVVATGTGRGSFLLGRQRAITSELVADWDRELQAMGAPPSALADMIRLWKKPIAIRASASLAPDDVLIAEVLMRDVVVSRAEITIWPDRLIDVAMADTTNP
ncbi:MAG: hypothetical protein ACRENP_16330 [Longimicrobiales bacterium]